MLQQAQKIAEPKHFYQDTDALVRLDRKIQTARNRIKRKDDFTNDLFSPYTCIALQRRKRA